MLYNVERGARLVSTPGRCPARDLVQTADRVRTASAPRLHRGALLCANLLQTYGTPSLHSPPPAAGSLRISYFMDSTMNEHMTAEELVMLQRLLDKSSQLFMSALLVGRAPQGVMMSEACIHSCGHSTQPAPDVEADVMVLVKWAETIAAGTAAVDSSVRCPLDVAAFAAVCCLDQWDRPIGGVIWLCPRLLGLMATKVDGQSEDDLFRFTSHVLAHEFAHILGFDEQLFDLFRWADGTPRVSPSRLHFNCTSLRGAPVIGSHWNLHVLNTELMAPTHYWPFELHLSPLTWALFNDSGWYTARATAPRDSMAWGRGWGCSFAQLSMPVMPQCDFGSSAPPHLRCTSASNNDEQEAAMAVIFGQLRGHSQSTCMQTSLYRRGYGEDLNASMSAKYRTGFGAMSLCFAFRCSRARGEVMMSDLVWHRCDNNGLITREGYHGAIVCPPISCKAQWYVWCGVVCVVCAFIAVGFARRKCLNDRRSEAVRLDQLAQQQRMQQRLIRRRELGHARPSPPLLPCTCTELQHDGASGEGNSAMNDSIEMGTSPPLQHVSVSLITRDEAESAAAATSAASGSYRKAIESTNV